MFEALYGRRCRSLVDLFKLGDAYLLGFRCNLVTLGEDFVKWGKDFNNIEPKKKGLIQIRKFVLCSS